MLTVGRSPAAPQDLFSPNDLHLLLPSRTTLSLCSGFSLRVESNEMSIPLTALVHTQPKLHQDLASLSKVHGSRGWRKRGKGRAKIKIRKSLVQNCKIGFDIEGKFPDNGAENLLCKITASARRSCTSNQHVRVVSLGNLNQLPKLILQLNLG